MLERLKELFLNQYEAAFCTLNACIDRCPDSTWDAPVAETAFCQVLFHTLLFADIYLGQNEAAVRLQPFHLENKRIFRDYEELEDRIPVLLYDKTFIKTYLAYCRKKAAHVTGEESAETLNARPDFPGRNFSRAELHVYNIRHIQNHAAQLNLTLFKNHKTEIIWVGSGWRQL
ncbi:hypothetical protein HY229_00705 [Candidatus Acetothermia bacterium]|nr:hypothetical protein [Candidatus Acetothermia bacterium]MBI3642610.1 hypothetical protein [Candidatus Acetothermia bacterium]